MDQNQAVVAVEPIAEVALQGEALYASLLAPAQVAACVQFVDRINEHAIEALAFTDECADLVALMFPKPTDYATWQTVRAEIERNTSNYGAKVLREAYTELHGALPSKGDKRNTGATKGQSAKKSAQGLQTRVAAVLECIDKIPADKVDAKVLARLSKLATDLALATDAFSAMVNA